MLSDDRKIAPRLACMGTMLADRALIERKGCLRALDGSAPSPTLPSNRLDQSTSLLAECAIGLVSLVVCQMPPTSASLLGSTR